jgi:hypothetical protein
MVFKEKDMMKILPVDGALAVSVVVEGCWTLVWNYIG